ncbi:alpha/beta hydrolase [Kaistella sp. G5-32]|uniref:Alpha/beta hydrolase n=1 Tax=Kaistella gelatinilytica TaxID=2787636 RepID=A0ABS0F9E5_9FLAO|nr:alpha/beta hydrolase [Kaistella gelatinilytica]MBF8456270.1 alpha/beta hydrolase [Kaistella gelatinilytica]
MNENNKERLIILSDLWGAEKADWIEYYTSVLENNFEVNFYDSCVLGEVSKREYSEEKLHHQFVNGGIEKAVENLLKKEKENIIILGFSIGGLIAWKAGNSGLKMQNLFAISSTRLRYETLKPPTKIELIYGEDDAYKPKTEWFEKLEINMNILAREDHELYKKKEIAEVICKVIIQKVFN